MDQRRWDPTRVAGRNEPSEHHRCPERPDAEKLEGVREATTKI